jgi:general secretion pathway protein E
MVRAQGIPSLLEDGMARVVAGVTTVDEVLRVAGSAAD